MSAFNCHMNQRRYGSATATASTAQHIKPGSVYAMQCRRIRHPRPAQQAERAYQSQREAATASWCGPWTLRARRGAASLHHPGGFLAAATLRSAPSPHAPPAVLPKLLCTCASLLRSPCLAHTCSPRSSHEFSLGTAKPKLVQA